MPVQRTHKQSDLEKRLKILENQLYGKKLDVRSSTLDQISNFQSQNQPSNIQHPTSNSDVIYLKQDLTKILILGSIVVGIQLVLYFSHILERVTIF